MKIATDLRCLLGAHRELKTGNPRRGQRKTSTLHIPGKGQLTLAHSDFLLHLTGLTVRLARPLHTETERLKPDLGLANEEASKASDDHKVRRGVFDDVPVVRIVRMHAKGKGDGRGNSADNQASAEVVEQRSNENNEVEQPQKCRIRALSPVTDIGQKRDIKH